MVVWVNAMWFVVRPLGKYLARRADARAAITPVEKARLTTAFETLGPERVALGLTATGHGWGDCFLSYATGGQPYGLRPALTKGWRTNRVPGLSADVTQVVVRVWDRKEGAFRDLAGRWLERQPSRSLYVPGPSMDRRDEALSTEMG
jgi:hypothetical protein